jgi:hypothetical protein
MDVITRMERMIEAEPNKLRRWAMRKVLANTIKKMEVSQ